MQGPTTGPVGNNLMEIITFYTQAIGSSHIASGKPCQDNGTHHNENGVSIAIVCDGHGGESYVRSDIGSKLAAEIAKEKILSFVERTPSELFLGKRGAVTVIPTVDPRSDKHGKKKDISLLSESEMDLLKQNISYYKATENIQEIENSFRELFNDILQSWNQAIIEDSKTREFSRLEKEKLGSQRLQKAYGSTLMAAVRTPRYWFAFHIGDGRLFTCDEIMQWSEPVPWDCNCFLNVTTSLCDREPVNEFRYAFDGTGSFPIAFALGSDGIDDTFIKTDLIHKFYSQLLNVFNERDQKEAEVLLIESLSSLSQRGSHDDMSVAAIIDKDRLPKAIEYYKIISEVRALTTERDNRQAELIKLDNRISQLKFYIEEAITIRDEKARAYWSWWLKALKRRTDELLAYQELKQKVISLSEEFKSLSKEMEDSQRAFDEWKEKSSVRVSELKELAQQLITDIKKESALSSEDFNKSSSLVSQETIPVLNDSENLPVEDTDDPNTVLLKANSAKMSQEDVTRMEQESDSQIQEIFNNHSKLK